jgi:protease-4
MPSNFNISEELVRQLIKNQKSDRRWKNFRFFCFLLILAAVAAAVYFAFFSPSSEEKQDKKHYVSLVRLNGVIAAGNDFSAKRVIPLLDDAFKDKHAKGVVLEINSGGGSPVQSAIIHDKILELKKKYHKTVIIVGEDMLASGAYLVAMAGDKVYVNQDTITGSIGVIMEGFGFKDAIEKIGVSRRVFTAGKNKDQMDPFESLTPGAVKKTKQVLDEVHEHFIEYVVSSRGKRLKGDRVELFSGDFWVGSTALKYGIVDGLGNLSGVLQREFKTSHYVDYSERPSLIRSITKGLRSELNFPMISSHNRLVAAV